MLARRTAYDDDQWVPFLEVYRGDPPSSRGRRAGVFPKPVAISVGNVVGNVQDSEDFDRLLTRDLDSYFSDKCGTAVTVTYEFAARRAESGLHGLSQVLRVGTGLRRLQEDPKRRGPSRSDGKDPVLCDSLLQRRRYQARFRERSGRFRG